MKVNKLTKVQTKKFKVKFRDKTASGGVSVITFIPDFDKLPSTGEPVDSIDRAIQYGKEVFKTENTVILD